MVVLLLTPMMLAHFYVVCALFPGRCDLGILLSSAPVVTAAGELQILA
jgi:hypothetical protein